MKKVILFLLIFVIYFSFIQVVEADVDYHIDSIEFNSSGSVTVKGWALIPEIDNYGGYTTRIYVSLVKRSGEIIDTVNQYGGLVYSGGDTYGSHVGKTGNNDFCYIRTCYKANGTPTTVDNMDVEADWTYTHSHINYEYKGGCVYRNSYFTATFDRINLASLSNQFYLSVDVKKRRDSHAFDVCSRDSAERASAANIISRGAASINGSTDPWAGRYEVGSDVIVESATVTSVDSCTFDGTSCNGMQTDITTASGEEYTVNNYGNGRIFSITHHEAVIPDGEGFNTAGDELKYEISSMQINSAGQVNVQGYAYIEGQNNYGDILTSTKLIAVGGDGQKVYSSYIRYYGGYLDSSGTRGNESCWKRLCNGAEDALGYRKFVWEGNCFKYNVYFSATIDSQAIKGLVTSGEIKFKIGIDYDTVYGTQPDLAAKCTNDERTNTNNNLLFSIRNGYYPVRNSSLEKNITLDHISGSRRRSYNLTIAGQIFDLSNSDTQYNMYIDGENVPFTVDVRRSSDTIRLLFDNNVIGDLDAADKHLNLVCDVSDKFVSINSKTKHTVTVPVSYNQVEDGCPVTGSSSISADYYMIQSSDLTYSVDKGPIYAGGGFKFGIDYINTVRWFYGRRVDECENIGVSGIKGTCQSCSICGSYSCPTEEHPDRMCCESCEHCGCETGERKPDQCSALGLEAAKELYEDKIPKDRVYDNSRVNSSNITKVELPSDSNSVKNMNQRGNDVGSWTCDDIVDLNGRSVELTSVWHPGEERIVVCRYELKNSYITRNSADVIYYDPSDSSSYINGNKKYYIPLKWPGDVDFELLSKSTQLSTVNVVNFDANYKCDIDVEQALYDLENGGFKFIYRPIDLYNPFPGPTYGDFREMKSNWENWINDNTDGLVNNYSKEYSVNLMIDDIREISKMPFNYNERLINNGDRLGYIDHSINNDGTSNFIRDDFSNLFNLEHPSYFGLGSGN